MATASSVARRRKRTLPTLPAESDRTSVIKQKFEIPEFDVERLHKLPPSILSQINTVDEDKTLLHGKFESLKDTDLIKKGKTSQITLKSGKKLDISLVEGSFRRIAGIRENEDDSGAFVIRTVEIKREPGKSLGFYIRQGDGWKRRDGIFVSRVNLGSLIETNGLLRVGDEILKVNSVDVTSLPLDDVVVIMQYVKRLVLTVKVLTSVSLTRTFSKRLQKRTPTVVASVRRTSSYAEKIALRQHSDSLSSNNNDELKFGNQYEEISMGPQDESVVRKPPPIEEKQEHKHSFIVGNPYEGIEIESRDTRASPKVWRPEASNSETKPPKGAHFFSDDIKVGNPYEDIEMGRSEKETEAHPKLLKPEGTDHGPKSKLTLDTKVEEPNLESPKYEEISMEFLHSLKLSKQDTYTDQLATKSSDTESPIASSTPVLHRKLDTSTPLPKLTEPDHKLQEKESELVLEDPYERPERVSFDAPPNFKPPPPPPGDQLLEDDRAGDSGRLNLTMNTTQESNIASLTHIEEHNTDTISQSDSLPPPIPPFLADFAQLDMDADIDEPPDTVPPPPPPSEPPTELDEDEATSTLGVQHSSQIITNTSKPGASEKQPDHEPEKSGELYSGMLAATFYGMDEGSMVQDNSEHTLLCTIAVDSITRVEHTVRFQRSSLERSLGEELDPFQIDLLNGRELTIRVLNKNADLVLEKVLQLSDLFPTNSSQDTSTHEMQLSAHPIGELTLSLEYQPMSTFIKRMNLDASHYSCATFKDFVDSSPTSSDCPLVVERCVRIIEEYGLKEPGLYQRCASESAKSEAFHASISQTKKPTEIREAVSKLSVHAFTGVLKDFFRNLPEPLLTNDISLSLTETASMENAALIGGEVMKSFIECLPEEVVSTLKLLLLHFKRVCEHSQENGTSVEKLSEIFGPLLLAPSLNVDMNTSSFTTEGAEDYDSQAKAIAILMSLQNLGDSPLLMHKV